MPKLVKSHILMISSYDWADECDFVGFRIMSKFKYHRWLKSLDKEGLFPATFSFGSNQEVEIDSKEHYLSHIKIVPAREDDEKAMIRLFGKTTWGAWKEPDKGEAED